MSFPLSAKAQAYLLYSQNVRYPVNSCFQYSVCRRIELKIIVVVIYWGRNSEFFLRLVLAKNFHIWISHHVISEGALAGKVELIVKESMPQQVILISLVICQQDSIPVAQIHASTKKWKLGKNSSHVLLYSVTVFVLNPNAFKTGHKKFRSVLQSEKCLWIQKC